MNTLNMPLSGGTVNPAVIAGIASAPAPYSPPTSEVAAGQSATRNCDIHMSEAGRPRVEFALYLASIGFPIFLVRQNSKEPRSPGWPDDATRDPDEIKRLWGVYPNDNIGCACGVGDAPLSVVDLDTKHGIDGVAAWNELCADAGIEPPVTWTIRTPSGGVHLVYRGVFPNTVGKLAPGIDTRGLGGYVVGLGSVLETGSYSAENTAPIADAPGWLLDLMARPEHPPRPAPESVDTTWAVEYARHEVETEWLAKRTAINGTRNITAWHRGRRLYELAVPEADAVELLTWFMEQGAIPDEGARACAERAIGGAYHYTGKNPPGAFGSGLPAQHNEPASAVAAAHGIPTAGGWPDPVDIFGDLLTPEPRLTADMLPPALADFAFDAALGLGVEPAGVAIPCLVACAGALHDGVKIQPRQLDTRWTLSARLWSCRVDQSGANKTSSETAATKPSRDLERDWRREDEIKMTAYTVAVEAYKVKLAAWKETVKNCSANERLSVLGNHPVEPEKPPQRRLVASDFTFEALRDILNDNPRGITLVFDELTSMLGSFGTYNNGAGKDRGMFCSLWYGNPLAAERRKGSTACDNWGASVISSVQPAKLAALARKGSLTDDGLLQRFFLYSAPATGPGIDRAPNIAADARYAALIRTLVKIDPSGTPTVALAPAARPYWDKVANLTDSLEHEQRLGPELRQHMSKVRGLYASLLLTLWAIEWAAVAGTWVEHVARAAVPAGEALVSAATAERAYRLVVDFFIPQAIRTYGDIFPADDSNVDLDRIARAVLAHGDDKITARDIGQCCREYRKADQRNTIRGAMERLAMYGWVKPAMPEPDKWLINPQLFDRFAAMQATEQQRRAEAHRKILERAEIIRGVYGGEVEEVRF